jgi:signal transduction histidine kinase
MLRRSLTAKILIAVGVTVATVIAIYTYFVIRVQSAWWQKSTYSQNALTTTLVQEYLEGVMLSDRHTEVQQFLNKLQSSQGIYRGRVIDLTGKIIFSTDPQEVKQAVLTTPPDLFRGDDILYGTREENGQRLAVAMKPVPRGASCRHCHQDGPRHIGAIVLEQSMTPAEASVASNRNLMIVYGLVILALVGVVLWLLILRLVTQPVSNVLQRMRRVQAGDLTTRAETETVDEIGQLTRGFNSMVGSLETATRELQESHEKQIQQAGKLASIGELASGIAHEIRNPLAGIGAAVEVLSENGGNGQHGEIVDEIRRQITRLNTTLRELLDFSRQREPEIAPCAVCEIVKPMLGLIRPDAQKQRVNLVEDCPADLPPLCADAQQVQQAVLNILLNAIQSMPGGGTLTLRAEALHKTLIPGHDQAIRISITDTGVGIAADNLPKIFSPFFSTKHRGTGLGLAITRTIVEKHRGAISVDSEVGRGSTFRLEFAACAPGEAAAAREGLVHG